VTTLAPEVSIVMPVFNERATIEQAIRSVLDAGVADSFELIVVDDGSTDGSSELLSSGEWPEHVRVLSHDRNRGKGAALRTALAPAGIGREGRTSSASLAVSTPCASRPR